MLRWPEKQISVFCAIELQKYQRTAIQHIKKLNLGWQVGTDFSATLSIFLSHSKDLF